MKDIAKGITLKMEATDPSTVDIVRMEAASVNNDGKKIRASGCTVLSIPGQLGGVVD